MWSAICIELGCTGEFGTPKNVFCPLTIQREELRHGSTVVKLQVFRHDSLVSSGLNYPTACKALRFPQRTPCCGLTSESSNRCSYLKSLSKATAGDVPPIFLSVLAASIKATNCSYLSACLLSKFVMFILQRVKIRKLAGSL